MIRLNPDNTGNMLTQLTQVKAQEDDALLQLSSGRRVNKPSDDPAASATMVGVRARSSADDQYLQNISTVRATLSTADSTLNSVVLALQHGLSIAVEGANGTQSPSGRSAMADDIEGVRDQILSLANTSFAGSFLFAGTAINEKPFVADATSPSGFAYAGNSNRNSVQIGENRSLDMNTPGDQIFSSPGADLFGALGDLIQSLRANDVGGIEAATGDLRTALDHVTAARVPYGNTLAQLDNDESFLRSDQLQMTTKENDLISSDPLAAISALRNAQFAREATLSAFGQTSNLSLLDYLK